MNAMCSRGLGDLAMPGVLRTDDGDVETFGAEEFAIVLIEARRAGKAKRAVQVRLAAPFDRRQRWRARDGVGARDYLLSGRSPRSGRPAH